jgi:hypothetical protein
MHTIFMLGWDRYRFHKKCARKRYTKHEFLDPVKSTRHVVHSSAFGAQNVDALFFI